MSFFNRRADLPGLVERCRRQDPDAWNAMVDQFSGLVYSIARRYRLNAEDSADVFQNTFQALYTGLNQIENPETVPKWLSVTASRLSLRQLRNSGQTVPFESESGDLAEILAAEDESAEANAVKACEAQLLRDAIAKLGGRCSELLPILYLTEDSSYQDATDQLGIPLGAIGPTRARCLEKLRKMLEKDGFF